MSWPAAVRVRTLLAPPGHPPVHQLRVAGEAGVGADAEALHHAGAEALDAARRPARRGRAAVATPSGCLRSTATLRRPRCIRSPSGPSWRRARPTCARSTRITSAPRSASSMAANGPGPDAGELDDPVAGERSGHGAPSRRSTCDRTRCTGCGPCQIGDAACRRGGVNATIDGTMIGHSGSGRSWPMSARSSRWAPGIASAVACRRSA